VVLHHILNSLNRQQLWAGSWMARLATPLAATAFTPLVSTDIQNCTTSDTEK
jgi:hypothetical protein